MSGNINPSHQTSGIRNEVIMLLGQFVHLIIHHTILDLQDTPKFRTIIHELCERAPDVAHTIAGTI
ncbi:hypothetical protein BDW59DRAFT_167685 [Aspergillus cavernicola]|uniref:Uncharacterized protein n=1 Tax=Aspergillus cavernicola TaxID=176166 RepID=A0ABR4HDQ7_9EURO